MDAIALHQYGFDCAVASLGTSLTEEHANILAKYTNQVSPDLRRRRGRAERHAPRHPDARKDRHPGARPADAGSEGPGRIPEEIRRAAL
ncbi:MAG: toprim domain-containing protein [Oscillospiraceae bacterium]